MLSGWLEARRARHAAFDEADVLRALAFFGAGLFVSEDAVAIVARLNVKRTCAALQRLERAYRVEHEYRRTPVRPYVHRTYRATATPERR